MGNLVAADDKGKISIQFCLRQIFFYNVRAGGRSNIAGDVMFLKPGEQSRNSGFYRRSLYINILVYQLRVSWLMVSAG